MLFWNIFPNILCYISRQKVSTTIRKSVVSDFVLRRDVEIKIVSKVHNTESRLAYNHLTVILCIKLYLGTLIKDCTRQKVEIFIRNEHLLPGNFIKVPENFDETWGTDVVIGRKRFWQLPVLTYAKKTDLRFFLKLFKNGLTCLLNSPNFEVICRCWNFARSVKSFGTIFLVAVGNGHAILSVFEKLPQLHIASRCAALSHS